MLPLRGRHAVMHPLWRTKQLTAAYDMCREALHGEGAPLQQLVDQLLGAARHSPRLLALTALHLGPHLLACPPVALLHQSHIRQLLLCDVKSGSPQVFCALQLKQQCCQCLASQQEQLFCLLVVVKHQTISFLLLY